jgi:UDP-2-acetamido-2-deoxy-ribo-hexuluronate aminotransferase
MSSAVAVREINVAGRRPTVPLFSLTRQGERLGARLTERMAKVLEHGQFILGPEVAELESALARYAGVRHAIGVSSGRDALIIALMGLGVVGRDAVFVPAFTFSATAGAVVAAGAVPVFTDIDPATCNMAAEQLERAIELTIARGELRPKAVIPVDLYGLPADYAAIEAVSLKYGLTIVADAAQSFGAMVGARRVGTLAQVTAISFYPTKPLGGFGDGGAILTNDSGLADAMRQIRSHGTQGSGDVAMRLGMTGRLDTLQAAVLLAKLEVFDETLATRRRIAARYQQALEGVVATPHTPDQFSSAWALYTIRLPTRDAVRQRLAQSGIETGLYYRVPLHRHPAFADCLTGEEVLPISERLANEVLSLPFHPALADADVDRVIETVLREVQ